MILLFKFVEIELKGIEDSIKIYEVWLGLIKYLKVVKWFISICVLFYVYVYSNNFGSYYWFLYIFNCLKSWRYGYGYRNFFY